MRNRTTLLLAVLVCLAGGWIAIMETGGAQRGSYRSDEAAFPSVDFKTVDSVTITSGPARVEVVRREDAWVLSEPVSDRPFFERFDKVLRALDGLSSARYFSRAELEEEGRGAADFGLGKQERIVVRVGRGGRTVARYAVGKAGPVAESSYLKVLDGDRETGIHLVESDLRVLVDAPWAAWRDPVLVRFELGDLREIVVRRPTGDLVLARDAAEDDWRLISPLAGRASADLVGSLAETLGQLPVEEFLVGEEAEVARNALAGPTAWNISLKTVSAAEPVTMTLAPGEGELWYASGSQREVVGRVREDRLGTLGLSAGVYRDRRLASLRLADLSGLEIEPGGDGGESVSLMQMGTAWFFRAPGTNPPAPAGAANGDKAAKLIDGLNREEVIAYLPHESDAAFGLDDPAVTLVFHFLDPEVAPRRLRVSTRPDEVNTLYAKWDSEPEVCVVGRTLLSAVTAASYKWRSLSVLDKHYSLVALRTVSIAAGNRPVVTATYDRTANAWTAARGEDDAGSLIDERRAQYFAAMLGALSARDWVAPYVEISEALDDPSLRIEVTFEDPEVADGESAYRLDFVPTAPGNPNSALYYGRVSGSTDIFLIDRRTYYALFEGILAAP